MAERVFIHSPQMNTDEHGFQAHSRERRPSNPFYLRSSAVEMNLKAVFEARGLIERAAFYWGGCIGAYGRHVAETGRVQFEGLENAPDEPVIWFTWHGGNLVGLALHHAVSKRACQALTPPGIIGTTMAGWLAAAQFEAVVLPKDGSGNAVSALKSTLRGLSKDKDLVIAVDGPHGPSLRARPGAFWLARMTGRPLVAVGVAARPAVRFPRWDRHLIPLSRAPLAVIFGDPIYIRNGQEIDQPFLDSMADELNSVAARASELVADAREKT